MAFIEIKVKGLKNVGNYIKDFPKTSRKELAIASKKSINTVEAQAVINAPTDTGTLKAKRRTVSSWQGGKLEFFAKYARAVHDGTRPHMPPVNKNKGLDLWARRKNLPTWGVAMNIKKRGTKANPFLERAIKQKKLKVESFFDKALKNISNAINK